MLSNQEQKLTEIDHPGAVELKGFYGGAARRRDSDHTREVCTPSKMLLPLLLARVK